MVQRGKAQGHWSRGGPALGGRVHCGSRLPRVVSQPVLVLKKNGTWRMCVDYTDLNKACPADPFALPRIDQIIDATVGCARLSFLDAYSGYHQIKMAVKDQEKKAFITPFGDFCYVFMPFGLKSAQATYQQCM